jgi:Bacterial membrane protein YfhO
MAGAAAAVALVVGGALIAGGGVWEQVNSGDLHGMYLPWYRYAARSVLEDGRLPLWNPAAFCGTPVLGLGQTAVLYPPVLVLFGLLPSWTALQAFLALHAGLLAGGLAAYLRGHDVGPAAAGVGALVAVVGVFHGPMLAGIDHPSFLAATAWIPWMLLAWERAVRSRSARWTAALALAAAMQWLAGYPDFALDTPVLLGLVALLSSDATLARRLGVVAVGLGLGAALAAVQLVPLWEAVRESPRAAPDATTALLRSVFAVHGPAPLARALESRFGLALGLAAVALARPTRVRLAWLAGLLWAVFALDPPLSLLYRLPVYASVRFPFGWSGVGAVTVGLLAAAGLGTLATLGGAGRAVAAGLGVAVAAQALLAIGRAPAALPPFDPGSAAFRAPDLALVAARSEVLDRLRPPDARVLSEREADAGAAMDHGLPLPNGHEPSLPPRRVVQLLEEAKLYDALGLYRGRSWPELAARPAIGALLGIGVVTVPAARAAALEAAGFRRLGVLPPDDVILAGDARPRARLVHRTLEAEGEEGTLAGVLDRAAGDGTTAVVERGALDPPLAGAAAGGREEARIVLDAPEEVVVETRVAAPALLVLGDTFYPGWHATVDGVATPILRADHAFRGVRLAPGRHRVRFRYAPASVRIGTAVTLGALLVLGVMCVAGGARRDGRT